MRATESAPRRGPAVSDLGGFSLWELFQGEVESQMKDFTDALIAIEGGETPAAHLAAAMRAAHSVKGAARLVQLDSGVRLAHVMEDCLVAAQNAALTLTSDSIDVLLASADLLTHLSGTSEVALPACLVEHSRAVEQMVARLDSVRAGSPMTAETPTAASEPDSGTPRVSNHTETRPDATHRGQDSKSAAPRPRTPPAAAVLTCQAGGERYGLDVSDIVEVIPAVPLRHLPGTPILVAGLCRYRGELVPVLDLNRMLGAPAVTLRYNTRIVIVNYRATDGSAHLLGLLAEDVDHGTEAVCAQSPSGVSTPDMPFLGPLAEHAGRVVQLLSVNQLISDDLRERLFTEA